MRLDGVADLIAERGRLAATECIGVALKQGSGRVDCYWFRPGRNTSAHQQSYVRRVRVGNETLIAGSGICVDE